MRQDFNTTLENWEFFVKLTNKDLTIHARVLKNL